MDVQLRKLADLDIDGIYGVLGYRPVKTKFGDTYIIRCRRLGYESTPEFEMFATKLIASYITQHKPTHKFRFTVK